MSTSWSRRLGPTLGLCAFASLLIFAMPGAALAQQRSTDEQALLKLHSDLLRAHRENNVEAWMAIEADSFVSVNDGLVTFPTVAERLELRTRYFANAGFEVYRDSREPLVEISEDGTLGWLIAEVEVQGTYPNEEGVRERFVDLWAWVELYRKRDGRWQMVGNASNLR